MFGMSLLQEEMAICLLRRFKSSGDSGCVVGKQETIRFSSQLHTTSLGFMNAEQPTQRE